MNIKCKFVILSISILITSLFTGCVSTTYLSNGYGTNYVTSVNSFGNYNLVGKTFYIESGDENISSYDLEFKEYAKYLQEVLTLQGSKLTSDKRNADMCILMNYSIADESYTETVPVPIFGTTGISSINTTSSTSGYAYGSAYSYGGYSSGSVYGNSTTNTQTKVNYNYGITGYQNVNRHVTQFVRVVNVYAFDNKNTSEEPIMLWKTNFYSAGSSSDFRHVMPYILYVGWGELGKNSDGWQNYQVFEDDYFFKCFKQGCLSNANLTTFPNYQKTTVSDYIKIAFVEKLQNETIICIKKTGCLSWYAISPYTYLLYNGKQVKISYADNYELGTKIRKECGTQYIRLHFPANLDGVSTFDFVGYKNAKENEYGIVWQGVNVR